MVETKKIIIQRTTSNHVILPRNSFACHINENVDSEYVAHTFVIFNAVGLFSFVLTNANTRTSSSLYISTIYIG
jgi:quinolinate synthase